MPFCHPRKTLHIWTRSAWGQLSRRVSVQPRADIIELSVGNDDCERSATC